MKRAKVVPRQCPNPLFEKWLLEWRDEVRLKSPVMENHFTKAIHSLQKYPLPLESGRDCILLQHFGKKLCDMLDVKLKRHLEGKRNNSDIKHTNTCGNVAHDILPEKSRRLEGSSPRAERASEKQFFPKHKRNIGGKKSKRNGNENPDCLPVSANELQRNSQQGKKAKPLIRRSREHSLSSSDSESCNKLPIVEILDDVHNEMLNKASACDTAKESHKVARKLQEKRHIRDDYGDEETANVADNAETLVKDQFQMAPNTFDILLLVDTKETAGGKTKAKNDATISELNCLKTTYEVRHLKIGDFAWIARCKDTNRELVLPYVVERKRMDDLASSIKDGRFHEQKFRLKQSGIPNIIYMVESQGKNQHTGMPLSTLLQASTNSLVQDGFRLKFTDSHRHSMQYLSILTTLIHKMYKGNHLVSSTKEDLDCVSIFKDKVPLMEFKQFNKAASKFRTFKVKEMFIRQLVQLKGLSVEKALAIVELYPTPAILTTAFQRAGHGAEKLLASIQVGTLQRQLGPALSKTIFELYTKRTLE